MKGTRRIAAILLTLCVTLIGLSTTTHSRELPKAPPSLEEAPAPRALAPGTGPIGSPALSNAATDTFHLAWYGFGGNGITGDPQGWTSADLTGQEGTHFHVAGATELTGGQTSALSPLSGARSMWCGRPASSQAPYCAYVALPGYGNLWEQYLITRKISADSVRITYTVFWDSEPGYDHGDLEWSADSLTWTRLPVGGPFPQLPPGRYSGMGPYPGDGNTNAYFQEDFSVGPADGATTGNVWFRFKFKSDGAFSDQDGFFPTDGALLLDDITIEERMADGTLIQSTPSTFESAPLGGHVDENGMWTGTAASGFGDFADLYKGSTVLQEDPCVNNLSFFWAFFDDPNITNYACHTPTPQPLQGATRFGPDDNGRYLHNEIWSPRITNAGTGDRYIVSFDVYRDLPTTNVVAYTFRVRPWNNGCPGRWKQPSSSYFGGARDWYRHVLDISTLVSPSDQEFQLALGVYDFCPFFCGVYGPGDCHSHAPLFDNVHLVRVNTTGVQFQVQHRHLFQDNFAANGSLNGRARADMAQDILPVSSPTIRPGDSIAVTAAGVDTDPNTGVGPAAYLYVSVWPPGQPGKGGTGIEAQETRAGIGKRYPLVATTMHNGFTWYCFRGDSVVTATGTRPANRYAFDLNDLVFTPGDTICYVICAEDTPGQQRYFSRRVNGQGENFVTDDLAEALSSPMEFSILPAAPTGNRILYVDAADDRSGPPQLLFDSANGWLTSASQTDRYDILAPSSNVGNSLASRIKNITVQITNTYKAIIWLSGDISAGTIDDGKGMDKSDDYSVLYQFLDQHSDNPGLYLAGDNIAQEWVTLAGGGAANLRSQYLNFNLVDGNHVNASEPVSPLLTAVGSCFIHLGVPDKVIAFGGCPAINDFDLLQPTGFSAAAFRNLSTSRVYMIQQATTNSVASTARVMMQGISFESLADTELKFPFARLEVLRDVLIWLQNVAVIGTGAPDDAPALTNRLDNAFPNPFNPTTTIRYSVKTAGQVTLNVYDVRGALVRTLVNEAQAPQPEGFAIEWDGRDNSGAQVASGVYFYRLRAEGFSDTKKMVLLK